MWFSVVFACVCVCYSGERDLLEEATGGETFSKQGRVEWSLARRGVLLAQVTSPSLLPLPPASPWSCACICTSTVLTLLSLIARPSCSLLVPLLLLLLLPGVSPGGDPGRARGRGLHLRDSRLLPPTARRAAHRRLPKNHHHRHCHCHCSQNNHGCTVLFFVVICQQEQGWQQRQRPDIFLTLVVISGGGELPLHGLLRRRPHTPLPPIVVTIVIVVVSASP